MFDMNNDSAIREAFPIKNLIPIEWQLDNFIEQREYLVNGELRAWDGPMNNVISPISFKDAEGQNFIGNTPFLTENEALEALDAAALAYDNGTGIWPTMSIQKGLNMLRSFWVR